MTNKTFWFIFTLIIFSWTALPIYGQNKIIINDDYKCSYKDSIDDLPVFTIVEKMPEYIGGDIAFTRYKKDSINYSTKKKSQDLDYQSAIVVQFVIDTSGYVTNICLIQRKYTDHYTEFEKASMTVISKMPKWIPGTQNGRKVPVRFNSIVSPKYEK